MTDANDAAPAEVQKSKTDQELALAVVKAADAYNQFLTDAKAQADKLEACVLDAIEIATLSGIIVHHAVRNAKNEHEPFKGILFARNVEIIVSAKDRKA